MMPFLFQISMSPDKKKEKETVEKFSPAVFSRINEWHVKEAKEGKVTLSRGEACKLENGLRLGVQETANTSLPYLEKNYIAVMALWMPASKKGDDLTISTGLVLKPGEVLKLGDNLEASVIRIYDNKIELSIIKKPKSK